MFLRNMREKSKKNYYNINLSFRFEQGEALVTSITSEVHGIKIVYFLPYMRPVETDVFST